MRLLKVFHFDELVHEISLNEGQEYTIGRSQDCDVVIQDQSISRQHIKIFHDGGGWYVQCLSRFGNLVDDAGNEVENLAIDQTATTFSIYNYHFTIEAHDIFVDPGADVAAPDIENERLDLDIENTNTDSINFTDESTDSAVSQLDDKTGADISQGSISHLEAYLRITAPGHSDEIVKLEGSSWIIGRTDESDIAVPLPVVSRTHFQIYKKGQSYHIKDLKSSNGTFLNGDKLEANTSTPLESGDTVSVKEIKFYFEIRDSRFEKQLQVLSQTAPINESAAIAPPPGAVRIPPPEQIPPWGRLDRKKVMRIGIVSFLALAIMINALMDESGEKELASKPVGTTQTDKSFDRLTEEQKELVKIRYESAERLYRDSKYELALTEIQKLHEIVPEYKNSRSLEATYQNAIDTLKEHEELERINAQKAKIKQKVSQIVAKCRQESQARPNVFSTQQCLEPAIELDPENEEIANLSAEVQKRVNDIQAKQRSVANYRASVRKGIQQYQSAKAAHEKGHLLTAKTRYSRHIASSNPDPQNLKPKSKEALARVKDQIKVKLSALSRESETAISAGDNKRAVLALREAKKYGGPRSEIEAKITEQLRELNKKSRNLYQDARLEEGLGNIEAAKKKWQKILDTSLPENDYYKKAKVKLKKYGL